MPSESRFDKVRAANKRAKTKLVLSFCSEREQVQAHAVLLKSKEYNTCSKWSHAALFPLCRQADTSPQRGRGAISKTVNQTLPLPKGECLKGEGVKNREQRQSCE